MLIGVLSDTHGCAEITCRAVELLKTRGAELLVHCGDVGGPRVLDAMLGLPASFVLGNTDEDVYTLKQHASALGMGFYDRLGRITAGDKIVTFLHGDDGGRMKSLLDAQDCDLLLHGHTHVKDVHDIGRIRVINPGALQRAAIKTVALVNTDSREVEFLKVS